MKALGNIIKGWFLLATATLLGSCIADLPYDPAVTGGGFVLSMPGIDAQVHDTRTTPSQLDKPVAEAFHLNIVRQSNNAVIYDGAFTSEKIAAAPDDYTITASYGDNPLLGLDKPYYIGTTTATVISTTEPTEVSLPVGVGNALVSVTFGSDEEEAARFDRFYSDYAFNVTVGSYIISLTPDIADKSIYVRAGSTVTLMFTGYLKAAERQVTMPITLPDGVSNTLSAADHLIVTLSLEPNAESAVVTIVKAEVEKVAVEEKVSYNWLPRPVVTTVHQYASGELVGTDLNIEASFPDVQWEARIHQGSATGNVVRVLKGKGALSSTYLDNPSWPFLPAGTYVATYRYYSKQGKAYNFEKTTEFTIPEPTLTLTADAYTAHTKYEQGDIAAANACERLTVYEPKVVWSVANSLLTNANYTKTYTTSIAGIINTVDATSNNTTLADITNVPVSGSLHTLTVTGTFCGQAVVATKQLRITGLPVNFNPPSTSTGWSNDAGTTDFNSDHVRLGNYSWSQPHRIKNDSWINVPRGTYLTLDYDIVLHRGAVSTTANVKVGSQQIVEVSESTYNEDVHNTGVVTVILSADASMMTCEGSYGSGATHTKVYKLHFKYGQ